MGKKLLFAVGRPFSPLYGWAMRLRETGYRRGVFRTARMAVPVISVGNLTLGGTGKTPLVLHLARLLLDHGLRPAVISRGYGGATRKPVNIVSDGSDILLSAREAGDEPRLLAESLPRLMVLTGVVRRLPAARAVEMGADVLILDDGFQHLAVGRDLDLVLFSADCLAGNSRIFPGGDLREPVKALHRATAFVLTGVNAENRERSHRFADLLSQRFPGKPIFLHGYRVTGFVGRNDRRLQSLDRRPDGLDQAFALCGIAHPDGFRAELQRLGITPVAFQPLPDHHGYRPAEINRLRRRIGRSNARLVVTTEKDLVKLGGVDFGVPLVALRREVVADPDCDRLALETAHSGGNRSQS